MIFALKAEEDRAWERAAFALAAGLWALLLYEVFVWHPGYAHGDESDVVGFLQRVREGMPWRWAVGNGSLHKSLLYACMELWPGKIWVTSVPGLLALPMEALLLFVLGRRLGGSRAGFFAVLVGLGTAFTLVRARAGLSFSLFPVEWLGLLWLRARCRAPWSAALWGALLGLFVFDYEAWLPGCILMLGLPFLGPVPLKQRAWELAGFLACLALMLPWEQLVEAYERRRAASLLTKASKSASAGLGGLGSLVFGGKSMPYLAPAGHAVVPLWALLFLPLGLAAWGLRAWVPLAYLGAGVALVLAGGAPYGVPAHRFIAAWPALALVVGVGIERLWERLNTVRARRLLLVALGLGTAQQLMVWASSQEQTDAVFRGPIRNLKAAADAAWAQSRRLGVPLVTELHPLKAPQFRFAVGHALPLPDAGAGTVVAYLPWEYLPAVRGRRLEVATFQEEGGVAPGLVGILTGKEAQSALRTERELRPLMTQAQLFSLQSRELLGEWLAQHPRADAWARTQALDYTAYIDWHQGRYQSSNIMALRKEPLVSVRPLIMAAMSTLEGVPEFSLQTLEWARQVDPNNGRVLSLQEDVLRALARDAEADKVHAQLVEGQKKGSMFWD